MRGLSQWWCQTCLNGIELFKHKRCKHWRIKLVLARQASRQACGHEGWQGFPAQEITSEVKGIARWYWQRHWQYRLLRALLAEVGASSLCRRLYKCTVLAIAKTEFTRRFAFEMTSCLLVPTKITRALVPTFVSSSSVLNVTLPEDLFLGSDNGLHLDCAGSVYGFDRRDRPRCQPNCRPSMGALEWEL